MTEQTDGASRVNTDGSHQDDWNDHWDRFGEAAKGNPANDYRHAMVVKLLGPLAPGTTLLDIGSGQGHFANDFALTHPDVRVLGVEYSAEGVRRSADAAESSGSGARFFQADLLRPVSLPDGEAPATHAVCSEVLEHVDDPTTLMRNASALLAPGARVVVTVPGGPRSAFDKHIGHYRHFNRDLLTNVLTDAGLDVDRLLRTGFPFFNLYKLAVVARGQRMVKDVTERAPGDQPSRLERAATSFFRRGFTLNRDDSRFGWQLAAVAHVPQGDSAC